MRISIIKLRNMNIRYIDEKDHEYIEDHVYWMHWRQCLVETLSTMNIWHSVKHCFLVNFASNGDSKILSGGSNLFALPPYEWTLLRWTMTWIQWSAIVDFGTSSQSSWFVQHNHAINYTQFSCYFLGILTFFVHLTRCQKEQKALILITRQLNLVCRCLHHWLPDLREVSANKPPDVRHSN